MVTRCDVIDNRIFEEKWIFLGEKAQNIDKKQQRA